MIKAEYHLHTTFCDGKNTPREIIKEAILKEIKILGFSGHSIGHTDYSWSMTEAKTEDYKKEITALKQEYCDKIEILLGIEQDFYARKKAEGFDYIIGSVHFIKIEDEYIPMDSDAEIFKKAADKYFKGDTLKIAELYFENVSRLKEVTNCDIIGHFDVLTKHFDKTPIIDCKHPRYLNAAKKAIEKLANENVLFEINTGAISRGYKKNPYPSIELLKYIKEQNGKIIITGDCHKKDKLLDNYETAILYAKSAGFNKAAYITSGEIKYFDL